MELHRLSPWAVGVESIGIDALTGFGNMFAMLHAAKQGLNEVLATPGTLLAVMLVEISDFAYLSLELGEEAAKELQIDIANKFSTHLQASAKPDFQGRVFRLAAGEYALLVKHTSCTELRHWTNELRLVATRNPWPTPPRPIHLRISAACYPSCAVSLGHLLAYTHLFMGKSRDDDWASLACPGSPDHQNTQFLSIELHNNATSLIETFSEKILDTAFQLDEARQMAFTDPMTQLPNQRAARYYLQELLAEANRISAPLSLMLVDGDNLGDYNEQFGYAAGNEMIRWLGQQLRRLVPETNFVARWLSGDEFLILCPGMEKPTCVCLAETLCERLHLESRELLIPITVSVGTATYPQDGTTSEQLLAAIETANKLAKQSGRNRVVAYYD
ncbi:MAG TPA: diguanylate cyclase [Firmicutes bacterium]|nr:diguanylate cyclase [Bacillota bacterium]